MISTGETLALAEGIIDGTHVYFYYNSAQQWFTWDSQSGGSLSYATFWLFWSKLAACGKLVLKVTSRKKRKKCRFSKTLLFSSESFFIFDPPGPGQ